MKKHPPPAVTEAEQKVLEALWQRGESTIRDLRDALYPDGGNSKFATVQTLLARLVDKGLVRRRKQDANWIFASAVARDEMIGVELRRVADKLGGNSMTPLLTYLVETGELSAKERAHLRKLLDELPGSTRSQKNN
jgi:BlaI family transcriptional regulator, penicillinase repressor